MEINRSEWTENNEMKQNIMEKFLQKSNSFLAENTIIVNIMDIVIFKEPTKVWGGNIIMDIITVARKEEKGTNMDIKHGNKWHYKNIQ